MSAGQWLVEDMIPDGVTMLFGDSNVGKTFIGLHIAIHVAAGKSCFGREVSKSAVVYIYAEGGRSMTARKAAAKLHAGISDRLPLIVRPEPAAFGVDKKAFDIKAFASEIARLCHVMKFDAPGLLIIDTISANIQGNESEAEGAQGFMRAVKELATAINPDRPASILLLHHCGLSAKKRPRGSSVFMADVDCTIGVTAKKRTRVGHVAEVTCTKMRDGARFEDFEVTLTEVDVPDGKGGTLMRRNGSTEKTLVILDESEAIDEEVVDKQFEMQVLMIVAAEPGISDTAVAKRLNRSGGAIRRRIAAIRERYAMPSPGRREE